MSEFINFPRQQLRFSQKTKKWRKQHLDWADAKTFFNNSPVRKSVIHKKINYDLLNGKLHMEDLAAIINPDSLKAGFIPERIQHYPIMNSKLDVLRGEESKRPFDWRQIITNPNAISKIQEDKVAEAMDRLTSWIKDQNLSEEESQKELQKLDQYLKYNWKDSREIGCNELLKHYILQYNMPFLFNQGFMDAMAVGEEIYQCDIVGGEPYIERLNPLKIRVFKSGFSNKIEDADVIIYEDYWSPGKVIDTYYDSLSKKDMEYLENLPSNIGQAYADSLDNIDERYGFVNQSMVSDEITPQGFYSDFSNLFNEAPNTSLLPYDLAGNIRVIKLFWKSRRMIKKIKYYDENGEEQFKLRDETYICNKEKGEEEESMWVNQAWEGVKIGTDIYINMRPRVVQYSSLSNPSRCHFGIIGSIYNLNESRPFSLVDRMKQYNYLYDAVHDRLNKMMARNWGKIIQLDLAKVPSGWDMDKWLYYAKTMGLAVTDSFKEGNYGAATGKIVGALNNAQSGVIDADWGNNIQQYISILEYIKTEMGEISGINKQREGQVSNRETVGGVERATLQSSHITEWLFVTHEDVKRRALDCFVETAKIALKGRSKKFEYIASDYSRQILEVDGNTFAECDYGTVMDNGPKAQELSQKLDMLAQAALQNSALSFSTIMNLYSSASLAEKQRLIEEDERQIQERNQQAQQQQLEQQQQIAQMQEQTKLQQLEAQERQHREDNETKILVAEINSKAESERFAMKFGEENTNEVSADKRADIDEKIREFDAKMKLEEKKLELERKKVNKMSTAKK